MTMVRSFSQYAVILTSGREIIECTLVQYEARLGSEKAQPRTGYAGERLGANLMA